MQGRERAMYLALAFTFVSALPLPAQNKLVPANTNGNPSLQYVMKGKSGNNYLCQGTLVSAQNGVCLMSTASRCLETGAEQAAVFENNVAVSAWSREITFLMADFGEIGGRAIIPAAYFRGTPGDREHNDSAVVAFLCPSHGDVPIVPIASQPLDPKTSTVSYGKVMNDRAGLYDCRVWRPEGQQIHSRPQGERLEKCVQPFGYWTEEGDAGGGLFVERDGRLELVGTLHGKYGESRAVSLYAVNKSLDFVRMIVAAYANPANMPVGK